LILVDRPLHSPIGHASPDGHPQINVKPKIYPTIAAAIADMSRSTHLPKGSRALARLHEILKPIEGGFTFADRDPDYNNTIPLTPGWKPEIVAEDLWLELAKVQAPALIIRGTQSDRYPPQALARLERDFPYIPRVDLESGHDIANGAPDELIATVRDFLANRIDSHAGC
jgi:pimeloyl-ACP methyl ester carboxylesterase